MGEGDITIRPTKDTKLVDEAAESDYDGDLVTINVTGGNIVGYVSGSIRDFAIGVQGSANEITLAEVARRTGLSPSTLRRHARDEKLGARLVRGRWVTTEGEFMRYMEERLTEGDEQA